MAAYLAALPQCSEAADLIDVPAHIPQIVLSAANATESELTERANWVRASANGKHTIIDGSGHWIQLEKPEAVVLAVRELVEACRSSSVI